MIGQLSTFTYIVFAVKRKNNPQKNLNDNEMKPQKLFENIINVDIQVLTTMKRKSDNDLSW